MMFFLTCGFLSAKLNVPLGPHPWSLFVFLGMTLDSAIPPLAKAPFSWFLTKPFVHNIMVPSPKESVNVEDSLLILNTFSTF